MRPVDVSPAGWSLVLHVGWAVVWSLVMAVLGVPSASCRSVGGLARFMDKSAAVIRLSMSGVDAGIHVMAGVPWIKPILLR